MIAFRFGRAVLSAIALSTSVLAMPTDRYMVPRTEHGHPDFQGEWATAFLTTLERPAGVDYLIATPDQAQMLAAKIRAMIPALVDPDVHIHDINRLAMVKSEYRTSIIVDPKDGKMPFSPAGADLSARAAARNRQMFDDPEQRPLAERCLENLGYPPIRTVPVLLPRQIVQTRDQVVIFSEDAAGLRVIHLGGQRPPDAIRTVGGYSIGHWDGDTLVVYTTHLRDDDPARSGNNRPLVLSRDSTITERFRRVSDTELFYQFTIEDGRLYTQPWTGEFSMTRHDGRLYEYACHEGNYSLPNILRGGQAEAARRAETTRDAR